MSKDMLGPITRATIAAPTQHHGLILDVANKLGGKDADEVHKRLAQALRDEPITSAKPKVDRSAIIRVDRAAQLQYPDWMTKVMHPELEHTGPTRYDLTKVEQWLHDGQKGGNYVKGQVIYDHLKSNNMLASCLGLADGLAIQQKGIDFFRKFYSGKAVFLWRSVVQNRDGYLFVPCLIEDDGQVVVYWSWLDSGWLGSDPTLRFAS